MKIATTGFVLLLFTSCMSQRITTTWKADHVTAEKYRKILVVAILPEADSILRQRMETGFVQSLSALGYQAVSAIDEFGPKGLSDPIHENTFLKLCNNGIDAVIIVALLPKSKESWYKIVRGYEQPNRYYYERIWNYKTLQSDSANRVNPKTTYFWENILFDLSNLEAIYSTRTRSFPRSERINYDEGLPAAILKKMTRDKILFQRAINKKPF